MLVQWLTDDGSTVEVVDDGGTRATFLRRAWNVSFSPDGSRIAFSRPARGQPDNWDIWVADADGSHARDIVDVTGADDGPVQWSPDGSKLAFSSSPHGDRDLFVSNTDGTEVTNITAASRDSDVAYPWTSDGHILFVSNRSHTGGTFLYSMNPDGSDVQLVLRI